MPSRRDRCSPALPGSALAAALLLGGCGWDYTPTQNVLPDTGPATESEESGDEADDGTTTATDTGEVMDVPATYRFDCVDIQQLGDADDTVFQVITLQDTWASDIANHKLNILLDLVVEDEGTGTAVMGIRSGVGASNKDQCSEPNTASEQVEANFSPDTATWEPTDGEGKCASPAADGTAGAAAYDLALTAEDVIYIYAEDDDGTAFNCNLAPGAPNAIPIAAIEAQMSLSPDRKTLSGTLTGCMSESEGLQVCSCLAVCAGNEHPDCPGCPGGAVPLGLLLGNIASTQHCTDLLGETAFDITLAFTATRLGEVPMTCG